MIAAIVAPVGIRSIAMMRACLVSGPAADLDDAGADRLGGGSIVLRVQRVELLVEPMLGRDPRIDRTADRSDGWSLHGRASVVDRSSLSRRPKKRGPFHLVPVMAKATLERLS